MRAIWTGAALVVTLTSGLCFAAATEIDQVGQKFS